MTQTKVSLRNDSYQAIESFLKKEKFPNSAQIIEGVITVVNLISDYHEEGVALYPDVLLLTKESFFDTLAAQEHMVLGDCMIDDKSFSMAIKMCAPLAVNGWNIYLLLRDDNNMQYGIVTSTLTRMSVSLYSQVIGTTREIATCAYIRNIGFGSWDEAAELLLRLAQIYEILGIRWWN